MPRKNFISHFPIKTCLLARNYLGQIPCASAYVHTQTMVYSVGAPSALSFLFLVPLLYRHGRKETKEEEEDEHEWKKEHAAGERGEGEKERREKQKVGWMPSLLSATPWG